MFSEAISFTPQEGPIPLKINSLPIPLTSTTKASMKANWIVCGLYDQEIKLRSVSQRTRDVVVDGTLTWDHLHAVTPLNPAIRTPKLPDPEDFSAFCSALRGTISLNKHQNLLLLWLISFSNSSWVIRGYVVKWIQQHYNEMKSDLSQIKCWNPHVIHTSSHRDSNIYIKEDISMSVFYLRYLQILLGWKKINDNFRF